MRHWAWAAGPAENVHLSDSDIAGCSFVYAELCPSVLSVGHTSSICNNAQGLPNSRITPYKRVIYETLSNKKSLVRYEWAISGLTASTGPHGRR